MDCWRKHFRNGVFLLLTGVCLAACGKTESQMATVESIEQCRNAEMGAFAKIHYQMPNSPEQVMWCQFEKGTTCHNVHAAQRVRVLRSGNLQKICQVI